MFDHVTLRVPSLPLAAANLKAAIDELEIAQTTASDGYAVWGNLAITQADGDHPITRRAHIALIAPSQAHVDRFWKAGTDAGLIDDGPAGPRPSYADDYYAAFLKDGAGNSFEAVHLAGERPRAGEPTESVHIAFSGDDDAVRQFHRDAIAAGYRSNGEPGERPQFHAGYYAAFVIDPDGNNIEVVDHHR